MSDLSGLKNYRKKLERVRDKLNQGVSMAVAEAGAEIASREYGGKAAVQAAKISDTESSVVATGTALMFIEFGTGRPGQSSGYPTERLPKDTINFVSAGKERSTKGWVYYYDNPDTKVTVNGVEGWFFGSRFTTGHAAGMQMFHTSQELRRNLKDIAKKYLDEG